MRTYDFRGRQEVETTASNSSVEIKEMSGVKHDQEKPDMSLLSPYAMEAIARVMTFGAKKYSRDNWRGGIAYSRLIAAAMRHISAFNRGEDIDPESGLSHISHALCCLMMVSEFEHTQTELDDRYFKEKNGPR